MHTDPIADMLTRVRNASAARHRKVDIPSSRMKRDIARVLLSHRFIRRAVEVPDNKQNVLRVFPRYDREDQPIINGLERLSKPSLRRYARALMRDGEDADDLVQDCLERAWSRAHRWQPGSNLRAWLFTIMHTLYVNQVRHQVRRPTQSLELGRELIDPRPLGQDRAMGMRDLESGLAGLPSDQREVLLMICLEAMSYQQVAEILGLPIGTVMSRLHRARKRMLGWLEGESWTGMRRVK